MNILFICNTVWRNSKYDDDDDSDYENSNMKFVKKSKRLKTSAGMPFLAKYKDLRCHFRCIIVYYSANKYTDYINFPKSTCRS